MSEANRPTTLSFCVDQPPLLFEFAGLGHVSFHALPVSRFAARGTQTKCCGIPEGVRVGCQQRASPSGGDAPAQRPDKLETANLAVPANGFKSRFPTIAAIPAAQGETLVVRSEIALRIRVPCPRLRGHAIRPKTWPRKRGHGTRLRDGSPAGAKACRWRGEPLERRMPLSHVTTLT